MQRATAFGTALAVIATLAVGFPGAAHAAPGDAITTGTVRIDTTYESIGVVWEVTGDTNLNSTMTLEFRPSGPSEWRT